MDRTIRAKIRTAVCGLTVVGGLSLLSGCDQWEAIQGARGSADITVTVAKKAEIKTAPVERSDVQRRVLLPTTIIGFETTDLVAGVEGYVKVVNVNIGDEVSQGDVLVELDAPEFQADVAVKRELLAKTKVDRKTFDAELRQTKAHEKEQVAMIRLREKELERITNLVERGSIRREMLDEAKFAVESVTAAMDRIAADVEAAEAKVTSAEADVKVAQSLVKRAEVMLKYLNIIAPYDGVINERHVDAGAYVKPVNQGGDALLKIESVEKVRAVFHVPLRDAALLDINDRVELTGMQGLPGGSYPSREGDVDLTVTRIATSFNEKTHMMRAEIDIANAKETHTKKRRFQTGDYGSADLILHTYKSIAVVPEAAVSHNEELGEYVVSIDRMGICHLVPVNIRVALKGKVAVEVRGTSGKLGSKVAVSELATIQEGQRLDEDE